MKNGASRRRPGGRNAKVGEAIVSATAELLELGQLPTAEAIARRAGVQKTTLYRRWGTLEGLVFEVVCSRIGEAIPIPDTGSCRGDLNAYITAGIAFHRSPLGIMLTRLAPQVPEGARRAYWGPRLDHAAAMLERGKARGEVRADADTRRAVELLIAPLYLRALVTAEPIDEDLTVWLTDAVLAAMGEQ